MRPRTWTFAYAAAIAAAAATTVLEPGDELGLRWRGELQRPELAPAGEGRRAIVTRVDHDDAGIATTLTVALFAEGADARANDNPGCADEISNRNPG